MAYYAYVKKRRDFGSQPMFTKVPAVLLDSIPSDKNIQKQLILRNPVHREVQATLSQSEHSTNTVVVTTHDQGINHTEGGWPREINPESEEHVERYCRRAAHDDNYVQAVMCLTPQLKHCLEQNNAIDMYEVYFTSMSKGNFKEKYSITSCSKMRDTFCRSVSSIVWLDESSSELAVSYSGSQYNSKCSLWNMNSETKPYLEFEPDDICWKLACSSVDSNLLVAGLETGIVNLFDIRVGKELVSRSSIFASHRDCITDLIFVPTRNNTEFTTGSPDGQCLWWDIRNLSTPTEQLPISINLAHNEKPNLGNALGISALNYDRAVPTKFLIGTENGLVVNGNRMGKEHNQKLIGTWKAHNGPVRAIHRSPGTSRMFITCGDFSVRVWSEEIHNSPIIVTNSYQNEVTDVAWSPLRFSSYLSISGGVLYYWDFLRKYNEPVATSQVSINTLTKIKPRSDGKVVAVGDDNGTVTLVSLSENMNNPGDNDKALMAQLYACETKREHILDGRLREINLMKRLEEKTTALNDTSEENKLTENDEEKIEGNYFKIVNQELLKMGENPVKRDVFEKCL